MWWIPASAAFVSFVMLLVHLIALRKDDVTTASGPDPAPPRRHSDARGPADDARGRGSNGSSMWTHRHLLGIEDLSASDIDIVLDRAEHWHKLSRQTEKKAALLKGRTVMNLFFEVSTPRARRSRSPASASAADVVNVSPSTSSGREGEDAPHTAKNLEAHAHRSLRRAPRELRAPAFLAKRLSDTAIVNAGTARTSTPRRPSSMRSRSAGTRAARGSRRRDLRDILHSARRTLERAPLRQEGSGGSLCARRR